LQGTERWSAKDFGHGKAESQEGSFKGIEDLAFGSDKILLQLQNRPQQGSANGMQVSKLGNEQAIAYA
jgi:hypothetical protein